MKAVNFDLTDARAVTWLDPEDALRPWMMTEPDEDGEQSLRCPLHDDRSPSLSLNLAKDVWNCHAGCGGGPVGSLVQRMGEGAVSDAPNLARLGKPSRTESTPSGGAIEGWHSRLLNDPDAERAREYLTDERGITERSWKEHLLGWDGDRLTFPVFSTDGEVVNVRRRRLGKAKTIGLKGHGTRHLYPALSELPVEGHVIIVEGELDALVLREHGFDAFTCIGGAGRLPDVIADHAEAFAALDVIVWTDADEAGRKAAEGVVAALKAHGCEPTVVSSEGVPGGFDASDAWRAYRDGFEEQVQAMLAGERIDSEDTFWDQLPVLKHIYTHAKARMVSPWAVLGDVMMQAVTATPPSIMLPPIIGNRVSLNLFVASVALSGGGKGGASAAARDCLEIPDIKRVGVGSGEGIAHMFMKRESEKNGGGVTQHTTAVLMNVPEVDTIAALTARSASTILPELRKAWMGEELGFAYADEKKRLPVPWQGYRLCVSVGVQPERAGGLLDDAAGGTPQRFVWLPAEDREMTAEVPDQPDPRGWTTPKWPTYSEPYTMNVCEEARTLIRDEHIARNRGEREALDGHDLLCREKVAAALAILDGSTEVTSFYWRLSGTVMAVSRRTRDGVVAALAKVSAENNRARGKAEAARAVLINDAVEDSRLGRVVHRIANLVKDFEEARITGSNLRSKVAARDRDLFEEAVERAVEAGLITRHTLKRGVAYSYGSSG